MDYQQEYFNGTYSLLLAGALAKQQVLETRPVVAVTFKGLGGKYKLHVVKEPGPGEVDAGIKDPEAEKFGLKFVKKPEMEGLEGVFLDMTYQTDVPRPIGGAHTKERLEIERDRKLAENGAVLSGMTIGAIKLLDRSQIPELCIQEVGVTARIIFDDTRRAGIFQESFEKGFLNYRQYLRDRYDQHDPNASLERERDIHLNLMSRNLGTNMKAILDSGLNLPYDQILVWNVSTEGGLVDTADLSQLKDPRHAMSLCVGVLRMMDELTCFTGLQHGDYFKSPHFKTLVSSFIGEKQAERIASVAKTEVLDTDFRSEQIRNRFLLKVSGILTDMWLESKGCTGPEYRSVWQMQGNQVLKRLKADPQLRAKIGLPEEQLRWHEKILKQPAGSGVIVDDEHLGRITLRPYQAIDRLRCQIDSHERYMAGPSVRDTYFEGIEDRPK
ncbi:MAG: hypothetical protein FJY77_03790 [Candidatus Altiarchaeales archaeon]|nr:hypothetical protein [Candidatus Altiarchaeales archaeon]